MLEIKNEGKREKINEAKGLNGESLYDENVRARTIGFTRTLSLPFILFLLGFLFIEFLFDLRQQ